MIIKLFDATYPSTAPRGYTGRHRAASALARAGRRRKSVLSVQISY